MIDSHCHFDFKAFDADRESVWHRCQALGLKWLIIPGVSPSQWDKARRICEQAQNMSYAAGIHPYEAHHHTNLQASLFNEQLACAMSSGHCIGIGECGLDKRLDMPLERQIHLLQYHLQAAVERRLPIILHCVHADNEMIRTLKHSQCRRGVIHAFSGSYEVARQYIDMGFHLGIGGTITYQRAKKTRNAVASVPMDWLLLESDAPDMPLSGRQGQRNSPEYLPEIAAALAELKGSEVEIIKQKTSDNTRKLFKLPGDIPNE